MNTGILNLEETLASYLPGEEGLQKTVLEAMNYSFLAGGKRVRPRLMLEAYRLFGGGEEAVAPFMAAMEMIHTYSLVHDDLPAMDNDTLRRGKTTTWAKYGEDMGILAGDALLTYAFETAAKAFAMTKYPERAAKAIGVLANKAGIYGMAGGQSVDVELTGKGLTEDQMLFIYRLKTGALLEASLMIGGILAGASEEETGILERVGTCMGLAFQIRDDILDVTSTEEELGKPIGSDERNLKTTWVTMYGLEQAEKDVEKYTEEAAALLASLPGDPAPLTEWVRKIGKRKN